MGSKSAKRQRNQSSTAGHAKQVDQLFRRLGVPHCSSVAQTGDQRLGGVFTSRWDAASTEGKMGMVLDSVDAAVIMGIGMREDLLRQEIPWICDQLDRRNGASPGHIVDVGSGTGITAICLNLIQGHPVTALDQDPNSVEVCSQLAGRLGATVDAGCARLDELDRADLPASVTAILAQALVLYTWGEHAHAPGHSWESAVRRRMRAPEGADSAYARLFSLAAGSQLILVDYTCPEVTASIVSLAANHGLMLDLPHVQTFSGQVADSPQVQVGLPFLPASGTADLPTAGDLLDAITASRPRREGSISISSGWAAEREAQALPTPFACWSVRGRSREDRVAIGVRDSDCFVYNSTDAGARELKILPISTWPEVRSQLERQLDTQAADADRIRPWFGTGSLLKL